MRGGGGEVESTFSLSLASLLGVARVPPGAAAVIRCLFTRLVHFQMCKRLLLRYENGLKDSGVTSDNPFVEPSPNRRVARLGFGRCT